MVCCESPRSTPEGAKAASKRCTTLSDNSEPRNGGDLLPGPSESMQVDDATPRSVSPASGASRRSSSGAATPAAAPDQSIPTSSAEGAGDQAKEEHQTPCSDHETQPENVSAHAPAPASASRSAFLSSVYHSWMDFQRICQDTWWPEVLVIVFSITCLAALTGFLSYYDGRKLPSLPGGITLNTVAAILGTASKSALLLVVATTMSQAKWQWFSEKSRPLQDVESFDEASRGPLGSLLLLTQHTAISVCFLGSLATLLSLASDPFVQQLISYRQHGVDTSSQDALVRQAFNVSFGPDLATVIPVSLFGPPPEEDTFNLQHTCPTGNCTWEAYKSVGWCSQCRENVTRVLGDCDFGRWLDDVPSGTAEKTYTRNCSLELPSGTKRYLSMQLENVAPPPGTPGAPDHLQVMLWCEGIQLWFIEKATGYNELPAQFFLDFTDPYLGVIELSGVAIVNSNLQLSTTECVLNMCMTEYSTRLEEGRALVNRSRVAWATSYFEVQNTTSLGTTSTTYLPCWKFDQTNGQTQESTLSLISIESNAAHTATREHDISADQEHHAFCANLGQDYIFDWLNGTRSTAWYTSSRNQDFEYRSGGIGSEPSRLDFTLSTNKTIEVLFPRLATALTRQTMREATNSVQGTMRSTQTFVQVRWAWLALPVVMNLCGAAFLIIIALRSHTAKLPIWKKSNLTLLYHGLESEAINTSSSYRTTSEMDAMASAARLRLRSSTAEPGARLILGVQVDQHASSVENLTHEAEKKR